jgi:hypothetical protein
MDCAAPPADGLRGGRCAKLKGDGSVNEPYRLRVAILLRRRSYSNFPRNARGSGGVAPRWEHT